MNYLILEDNKSRISLFRSNLNTPGNLVVICTNVADAKVWIQNKKFDTVFLDHDLDGRIFVPSEEPNTGYQLAKWIAENKLDFNSIIIHSYNEQGAKRILEVLPQAKWVPFNFKEQ